MLNLERSGEEEEPARDVPNGSPAETPAGISIGTFGDTGDDDVAISLDGNERPCDVDDNVDCVPNLLF